MITAIFTLEPGDFMESLSSEVTFTQEGDPILQLNFTVKSVIVFQLVLERSAIMIICVASLVPTPVMLLWQNCNSIAKKIDSS